MKVTQQHIKKLELRYNALMKKWHRAKLKADIALEEARNANIKFIDAVDEYRRNK